MTRPRRRGRGAFGAPLLAAALGLGPLAATALPAAPAQAASSSAPIEVRLTSLTPVAPQPGDTLVLTGTLTNVSDASVANLSLALEISSRIGTRSEFDSYASDPDGSLLNLGLTLAANPVPASESTLGVGESEPFSLSLPLDQLTRDRLGLFGWQVRALAISVAGTDEFGTTTVGQLRTFLPWAPRGAVGVGNPVQVAWVWPLVDRPHRLSTGVWYDDTLAPELSAGGRLSGLLTAGTTAEDQSPLGHKPKTLNVPVTWVIDPMLLGDVSAMAAGYRVQSGAGTTTTPGSGSAVAKQWLAALKIATTRTDASVIPLPYADPDVVAASRAGGFTTTIGVAATTGRQIVVHSLGDDASLLQYGWPDDGYSDQRGIDLLRATGDTTMVLSDLAVPVIGGPPPTTPSAHTIVSTDEGQVQALLSDSGLDADVDSGIDNPDGSRGALQDYLAETLMIQLEAPGAPPRSLVVAPPRRWDPTPAYAAALLTDTGKVPWIQPVSLSQVRDTLPYTKVQRDPLTYPSSARHDELSASYLEEVSAARKQVTTFESVLPQTTPQIASYNVGLQQALSSAWRDKPKEGREQLAALSGDVTTQTQRVTITTAPNSYVTLTSHGGKVPVTVANHLDVPVSVIVHVLKNQRLTLRDNNVVRVIPAHQQVAVDLHASAKTSGVFPLKVELLTPTGRTFQPAIQLFVRSTVYGTITLVITGAATAALMVAVAIRLTRRALAARRHTAAAAS